jgi:hypothetical protein
VISVIFLHLEHLKSEERNLFRSWYNAKLVSLLRGV